MGELLTVELMEALLARRCPGPRSLVRAHLSPGLTDEYMDALTAAYGWAVPHEARVMWRWANGAEGRVIDRHLGFSFLPLEAALARTAFWRRELWGSVGDLDPDLMWRDSWLVLFTDGLGGDMLVDCTSVSVRGASPVLYRAKDDTAAQVRRSCDSLGDLVRVWLDLFDSGAIAVDEHRKLVFDESRMPPEHVERPGFF